MFLIEGTGAILSAMFLSGMWSGILSAVFIIAAILLTASRDFSVAYAIFVIYLMLFALFGSVNPFMVIIHNPGDVISYFIGYFVVGAAYSVIKFWDFVASAVKITKTAKQAFIEFHKLKIGVQDNIPVEYAESWTVSRRQILRQYSKHSCNDLSDFQPSNQKSLILNWIAFWPFSAVGLFIADPLQALVVGIYNRLGSVYDRIYKNTIAKTINMSDLDQ
jgi:hypothetical protein